MFAGFLFGGLNPNCINTPSLVPCQRTAQSQQYYYFTIANTTDGHATCLPLLLQPVTRYGSTSHQLVG